MPSKRGQTATAPEAVTFDGGNGWSSGIASRNDCSRKIRRNPGEYDNAGRKGDAATRIHGLSPRVGHRSEPRADDADPQGASPLGA